MSQTHINCSVCNSSSYKYIFERCDEAFGRQSVLQCKDCGLVFVDPLPDLEILKNHYGDYFFTQKFDYIESGNIWERFYELNLKYIEKIKNKGKLLEVGCGLGHFLNIAKRRDWEASGVELSEFASNYAMNNFNLKIHNSSLEKVGFADNQFDVVVLWATLEHMLRPLKELAEIYRIMNKGGLLAISVPNHNSFLTRLYGLQNTDMQHFEHIYHFPFRTLKSMLTKVGFIELRRMIVFGGSPEKSYFQDISQYLARILNIGSELRAIAFKPGH